MNAKTSINIYIDIYIYIYIYIHILMYLSTDYNHIIGNIKLY